MKKYCVGVDFGTLSARALIVDAACGREISSAAMDYPHAVMDRHLPDGTALAGGWALQHPQDYTTCLSAVIREALRRANLCAEEIISLGVDFTASTLLPVKADLTPLCLLPEYTARPHAYVKLWKHHAAQPEADMMTEAAHRLGLPLLKAYGGKVSSEWALPKIFETLRHDPAVYRAADRFMEAGDWLVSLLTGQTAASRSTAGYKAFYQNGYPSKEYLRALSPELENVFEEKMNPPLLEVGSCAGILTPAGAALTGLLPGTPVAAAQIDAHAAVPGAGITRGGTLLMILGTSACHMILSDREYAVEGICGAVSGGALPGLICFEAGQSCFGDGFDWFITNCLPVSCAREARRRNIGVHDLLSERAARLSPGESGLLALDWWNGSRSPLSDADLSGMILGMTLSTRLEEIYRALLEAAAYGTRMIVETFVRSGVPIKSVYACGGIAHKNPLLMQILSDVLGREIHVSSSAQTSALGSAMLGASAAGRARGGYDSLCEAAQAMCGMPARIYRPNASALPVYDALYDHYARLHDHFGRGENNVMKHLRRIRNQVTS